MSRPGKNHDAAEGDGDDDVEARRNLLQETVGNRRRDREATAYAAATFGPRRNNYWQWLFFVVVVWMIYSMLSHDYRSDAREYLKSTAGKTDEEIDRYFIPSTVTERHKAARTETELLRKDVTILQQKVSALQWKVYGTNDTYQTTIQEPIATDSDSGK